MLIPQKFMIAGLVVDVEKVKSILKNKYIGKADFSFQKIQMDTDTVPRQTTEQAFLHEIVHWILYIQGEHELRVNEKFVDQFAHLLYQVLTTGGMLKEGIEDDLTSVEEQAECRSGGSESGDGESP